MSTNFSELLQSAIELSETAAEEILKVYNSEYSVQQKEDKTPLTSADMAAHRTIVSGLKKLSPDIPILSEEASKISFEERKQWTTYWLVDPLDGTREFIKRNGEFTVNIALIENHLPIIGVIYTPVTGVCYYGMKGTGAFKMEKGQSAEKISVRPAPKERILVAGSRSHQDKSLEQFLLNVGEHELINMGSSLKSCLVAEGKVDIYPRLGPTSEWDTGAAQCIVEEAGGFLTTTDMKQMRYNTKSSLLNPHFLVYGDDSVDWSSFI